MEHLLALFTISVVYIYITAQHQNTFGQWSTTVWTRCADEIEISLGLHRRFLKNNPVLGGNIIGNFFSQQTFSCLIFLTDELLETWILQDDPGSPRSRSDECDDIFTTPKAWAHVKDLFPPEWPTIPIYSASPYLLSSCTKSWFSRYKKRFLKLRVGWCFLYEHISVKYLGYFWSCLKIFHENKV